MFDHGLALAKKYDRLVAEASEDDTRSLLALRRIVNQPGCAGSLCSARTVTGDVRWSELNSRVKAFAEAFFFDRDRESHRKLSDSPWAMAKDLVAAKYADRLVQDMDDEIFREWIDRQYVAKSSHYRYHAADNNSWVYTSNQRRGLKRHAEDKRMGRSSINYYWPKGTENAPFSGWLVIVRGLEEALEGCVPVPPQFGWGTGGSTEVIYGNEELRV
jgi:hypothetical protein